jgi:NAD(P)-dependent dehydrogenase (short-subunit alcohol dehydrogenase family)
MALADAKLFVDEGTYVFISGRRKDALDQAVELIGRNLTGVQGDSADLDDLDRLFDAVKQEKGAVDVLWASAGTRQWCVALGVPFCGETARRVSPPASDAQARLARSRPHRGRDHRRRQRVVHFGVPLAATSWHWSESELSPVVGSPIIRETRSPSGASGFHR